MRSRLILSRVFATLYDNLRDKAVDLIFELIMKQLEHAAGSKAGFFMGEGGCIPQELGPNK